MYNKLTYKVPKEELDRYPDIWAEACGGHLRTSSEIHPNCSCYHKSQGGYCRNKYCQTHGHFERKRQALKRCRYNYAKFDTHWFTLPYDCECSYGQYLAVRQKFMGLIRKGLGKFAYWAETEFIRVRPHLNLVIRLPLGSDFGRVGELVRVSWRVALQTEAVWRSQRVGHRLVGKSHFDTQKVFKYIFKTNCGAVPVNNCRPEKWPHTWLLSRDWVEGFEPTVEAVEAETVERLGLGQCSLCPSVGPNSPLDYLSSPPSPSTSPTKSASTPLFTRLLSRLFGLGRALVPRKRTANEAVGGPVSIEEGGSWGQYKKSNRQPPPKKARAPPQPPPTRPAHHSNHAQRQRNSVNNEDK